MKKNINGVIIELVDNEIIYLNSPGDNERVFWVVIDSDGEGVVSIMEVRKDRVSKQSVENDWPGHSVIEIDIEEYGELQEQMVDYTVVRNNSGFVKRDKNRKKKKEIKMRER